MNWQLLLGGKVWEPAEYVREEWEGCIRYCERKSNMVSDREKLLGDKRERLKVALVVDEKFEDRFPTLDW